MATSNKNFKPIEFNQEERRCAEKQKREARGRKLLNKLKQPLDKNMLWFFSDEKNFCQDQAHNRKNSCWLAANNHDMPTVMKTKLPVTVMAIGVVSSEGHCMPPHIFEAGLEVNTEVYLKVMEETVLPWIKKVLGERPWGW